MTEAEINEAVARKLGWKFQGGTWDEPWKEIVEDPKFPEDTYGMRSRCKEPRNYCTSIEAAWEIVEKIIKGGQQMNLFIHPDGVMVSYKYDEIVASSKNAPMAICLAFLKLP